MSVNLTGAIYASTGDVTRCRYQAVECLQIAGLLLTSPEWLWHLLHTEPAPEKCPE